MSDKSIPSTVHPMDILKSMMVQKKDCLFFSMKNILAAKIVGKTGQVTIQVDVATAHKLRTQKMIGGFVVADADEYEETAKSLE